MTSIDSIRERLDSIRDERHFPADMLSAHDAMVDLLDEIAALTRRAGGDAREWPDIGEDPMKGTPYEDRMAVSAAALRKAYTVQQPIVPDQTALVWRWHIAALLEAEIRLRSILARDDYAGDPDGDEPEEAGGDAIHTDDLAVDLFAARMKAKLAAARAKGRGGWDDPAQCSTEYLRDLLHDHVAKGDPIDVANFCMMLAHYGASTTPKPPVGGDAGAVGMSAVMGRILGHYSEDPGTLARIKGMVAQYREAPFRSADWLAGEIMRILDSEPANDTTSKPPAGGDAGAGSGKPDYEPAWREMYDALSWMHGCNALAGYAGWPLGKIATDLIDAAYPGLRSGGEASSNSSSKAHDHVLDVEPVRITDERGNPGLLYTQQNMIDAFKAGRNSRG